MSAILPFGTRESKPTSRRRPAAVVSFSKIPPRVSAADIDVVYGIRLGHWHIRSLFAAQACFVGECSWQNGRNVTMATGTYEVLRLNEDGDPRYSFSVAAKSFDGKRLESELIITTTSQLAFGRYQGTRFSTACLCGRRSAARLDFVLVSGRWKTFRCEHCLKIAAGLDRIPYFPGQCYFRLDERANKAAQQLMNATFARYKAGAQ